jgi:hypothetical protein
MPSDVADHGVEAGPVFVVVALGDPRVTMLPDEAADALEVSLPRCLGISRFR